MRRIVADIETNGLMPGVSKLHCLCMEDLDSGERWSTGSFDTPQMLQAVDFLESLTEEDQVWGHNFLSYDLKVLVHLCKLIWGRTVVIKASIHDTLIYCKMIWPMDALKQKDFPRWRQGKLPGQMIGAQRLEAWGYRLGNMKGEYSGEVKALSKRLPKEGIEIVPEDLRCLITTNDKGVTILDPWLSWNQRMQDYCDQDITVNVALVRLIFTHLDGTAKAARGVGWSKECIELEHRIAPVMEQLQEHGFGFDKENAIKLAATLKTRQTELDKALVEAFGWWWEPLDDPERGKAPAKTHVEKLTQFPDVSLRRISPKTGKRLADYVGPPPCHYHSDAPMVRVKYTKFNPKSRPHLGQRLQKVYGWVPLEWGGKNMDQAKVDETTIKSIPADIIPEDLKQTILEYLVVSKVLGVLSDSKQSWIDLCGEDGRLHSRLDALATVSHRAAHSRPNQGNVPSVSVEENEDGPDTYVMGWQGGFGYECRSLWKPGTQGWSYQTGVDASGIQLRLLGHYLVPYDEGAFLERVCTPGLDIHAENAKEVDLPRRDTKTVTYAQIFGSGPGLVGEAVGVDPDEVEELANSRSAKGFLQWARRTLKDRFIEPTELQLAWRVRGGQVVKKFFDGITGLRDLIDASKKEAEANGFVIGLDGRKLHVKSPHVVLSQLLQGGEAVLCKHWLLNTDTLLQTDYGLVYEKDYALMAWVHDEDQYEHREKEHHAIIAEASQRAIEQAGTEVGFRGTLATEAKLGANWKDCH